MYVLVIDDEPQTITPIINGLKRKQKNDGWGFYAPNETNLKDIRNDLEQNLPKWPDLILLDIMMPAAPGGDANYEGGLILLEEIKAGKFSKIRIDVKVILMSAIIGTDSIFDRYGDLIYRTMAKPTDLVQLFNEMKKIADKGA